ncbi:MAG: hypothetical protein WC511_07865 [Candidatus Pacearchaeota archaeon]|jgi:hypothetical protein
MAKIVIDHNQKISNGRISEDYYFVRVGIFPANSLLIEAKDWEEFKQKVNNVK